LTDYDVRGLVVVRSPSASIMQFEYHLVDGDDHIRASFAVLEMHDERPDHWALIEIETKGAYRGRGYGRLLVEEIRRWAEGSRYTAYTENAYDDSRGFYVKAKCEWLPEYEEFLISKPEPEAAAQG